MAANDPRDADALGKSPVEGFPSESAPSAGAPTTNAPDAIDDFVRDVRSRASGGGTPAGHQEAQLRDRVGGIARYVRTHSLHIAAAAAAALIVVVGFRAWPRIGESAGTLGSRLLTALTPTRLVEAPANDAAAAPDRSTAAKAPRATRPGPTGDAPRARESAPAVPPADQAIASPKTDPPRVSDTPSAAPLARDAEGGGAYFVYSNADADVQPPKLISEGPGQPAKAVSDRTRVLELLVLPDGSVEQVRLRSTEPQLMDSILLSRAKMWQFDPAQREGRPVPYRLVLLWDAPK